MSQSAFDPARIIEGSFSTLFGPEHAARWPSCFKAVRAKIPAEGGADWSWQQIASALIVWLACVRENEQLLEGVAAIGLTEVHVVSQDGPCTLSPAHAAQVEELAFLKLHPVGAVIDALTVAERAASLLALTMREDSEGRGAIEASYAVDGKTVVATYGDAPAPAHLTTYRVLRGDVLQALHRALVAAAEVTPPPHHPEMAVCVGATGPLIVAANENNESAA